MKKMRYIKKKRYTGSLTIEFAMLVPVMMTVFLLLASLLYTVHLQTKIKSAVSQSLSEISDDIYVASLVESKTGYGDLLNGISREAGKLLGLDINITESITNAVIGDRVKKLTYKRMGLENNKLPFWLNRGLDISIKSKENSIYCTSVAEIKLPVIEKLIGTIKLQQNNVKSARGISKLTGTDCGLPNGEQKNIVLCSYSYSGISKHPVYHDRLCIGRRNENSDTSKSLKIPIKNISKNGSISYDGRTFYYCPFCAANKLLNLRNGE